MRDVRIKRYRRRALKLIPVILSGGSGTRLWPMSSDTHPKQFLPLLEPLSSFQHNVQLAAAMPSAAGLIVVAGAAHHDLVAEQLRALSVDAVLLLEPVSRDSAAAVAAATAWSAAYAPDSILVVLSADNRLPDGVDLNAAIATALPGAIDGRVVSLGMPPQGPSPAYGYIQPTGLGPIPRVKHFIEKPPVERAAALIADGALWNSGIFVARADTLQAELARVCPHVQVPVAEALAAADRKDSAVLLGPAFGSAERISIDHGLLEHTDRASVVPVAFNTSDVGSWKTVWELSEKDAQGNAAQGADVVLMDSREVLVRSPAGVQVAVIGASRLAVIVRDGAVLVCDLDHSQSVKAAAALMQMSGANMRHEAQNSAPA